MRFRIHPACRFDARILLMGLLAAGLFQGCASTGGDRPIAELEDRAICELTERLFARNMSPTPLYTSDGGECREVEADSLDQEGGRSLFADADCSVGVEYGGESWRTFCDENLLGNERTRTTLGNPDAWSNLDTSVTERIETRWMAAQDVRLQLASVNQTEGNPRPYLKRVEYRREGDCALGMQIYRQDLAATGSRPLLLIHGGGWKYRGLGAVAGLGTLAPNFTSRDYVVFAPFYRLIETADGPPACHGFEGKDILDDIDAALAWVLHNGDRYGANMDLPISVVGQSAGGHLAAYLSTYQPEQVERGLLLYPAPDLGFFAEQLKPGGIYEGRFGASQGLLLSFLDQPGVSTAADIDLSDPELVRNSFPPIIQQDPRRYPILETVHGDADTTVPVELSVRLCQALNPDQSPSDAAYEGGGQTLSCGPEEGNRLTVVKGANHILDLRCFSGRATELLGRLSPELGNLCPPGSPEGEALVRSTLEAAFGRF